MIYSVVGTYQGKQREVTWNFGKLESAQRDIVIELEAMIDLIELDGGGIGPPTGPFVYDDIVKDPIATLFVMRLVFDEVETVTPLTGKFPEPTYVSADDEELTY